MAVVSDEEESEGAIGSSETVPDGDDDFVDSDSETALATADAEIAEEGSALPTEPTAEIAGESSTYDSTDLERDEASEEEIHDVALAFETSNYSPQGHEVTSPPSENDQGEGIRIVTEAVEQILPKRGSGTSASTSRADRAAENAGGQAGDDS